MNVEDKIRKLFKLAKGTNNEHEAAAALAQANALMQKHGVTEILATGAEDLESLGEFGDAVALRSGRVAIWYRRLTNGVARATGCSVWKDPAVGLMVSGRAKDRQQFMVMFTTIRTEVDRLTRVHAKGRGRSFASSFRYGVVDTIVAAIREEQQKIEQELREQYVGHSALVVVDSYKNRADDARRWAFDAHGLRQRRLSGTRLNAEGFHAGRKAGEGVYRGRQESVGSGARQISG